ncbi:MAG: thioredoxin family protein [Firmicutes bacterium]|nr:thioredoxin family protein [Bacillota bacterium]
MTEAQKKEKALKIIVPVLLICIVFAIWFVKNTKEVPPIGGNENPDFALHVTEDINLDRLKSYGLPIILDFGSDDCAPCKKMAPVLVELNEELQGKAIIKFIDVWKYEELAAGYPINLIPTQFFIDADGQPYVPADPKVEEMTLYSLNNEHVLTAHVGLMDKAQLLHVLEEMGLQ